MKPPQGYIIVPIECKAPQEVNLAALGIETEEETEFRTGYLKVANIEGFYPGKLPGRDYQYSVVHLLSGETISVKCSVPDFAALIQTSLQPTKA